MFNAFATSLAIIAGVGGSSIHHATIATPLVATK